MLDYKIICNNIEAISKNLSYKKFKLDISKIKHKEQQRKKLQVEIEKLQIARKNYSQKIKINKLNENKIDISHSYINNINKLFNDTKIKLNLLKDEIHNYLLTIPNLIDDTVPTGINQNNNIEIYKWGKPNKYNFPVKNHIEIGKIFNGIDFNNASKITGKKFALMHGHIAHLHRALTQFMLDLHTQKHGYEEYYLPYIVNSNSLYGTGQLPKFAKDLFFIKQIEKNIPDNEYALIPTAEIPLMNFIRNEIIEEQNLPIKMTAHTPCFRAEAGSYGVDTKGLIRNHQFDKIELIQIVKPEESMQALEELTGHAEKVLQLLELPYRKILLCSGELSFSSCKTYDLEVWIPAQNTYREVSSCSNVSDFQARRMKTRFRNKNNKKLKLVHTLNGSGLAVGRTLVAVLENYQMYNGSIEIPSILRPYMQNLNYINK